MHEEIKTKKKDGWFDVLFTIEALAVDKDLVENSLKTHIDKLTKVKDVAVYETKFLDTIKVDKPLKNVDEAFSQIVHVKFLAKDFMTLLGVVMVYGPSSIEILGPEKKEIKIDEAQNITNVIAGVVHQFAAAGAGGIILTPDK